MMAAADAAAVDRALTGCLQAVLADGRPRRLFVAYSGGRDSTALLLAAAAARPWPAASLHAFHFDHGLHPDSADWAAHCRDMCRVLEIPLLVARADTRPPTGASLEAWARAARYAAFARELASADLLLTAHHRDDLAETLLLMALRGSGPHGLASIAPQRPLGAGTLLRPLLDVPAAALDARATQAGLAWLSDPSNADARHDRNFLRQSVLPMLTARWPGAVANLAMAATLQRGAAEVLDEYADRLLAPACAGHTLDLDQLANLAPGRQRLLLRRWLVGCGAHAPDRVTLARVLDEVAGARADARPRLAWRGGEIRRYRRRLYWLSAPPPAPLSAPVAWLPHEALRLPGGVLRAQRVTGHGLREDLVAGRRLTVDVRRGGERIRLSCAARTLTVKHLLQQRGIPDWERALLPLIHLDGRLVAVADLGVAADAIAGPQQAGLVFEFIRAP